MKMKDEMKDWKILKDFEDEITEDTIKILEVFQLITTVLGTLCCHLLNGLAV